MKVKQTIIVPTGHILVVEGEHGELECLSLGDYGKDVNIKCDALGLTREPSPIRHTDLLPLEEKWVITVSTQYGCSMFCKFCDVPKVGAGRNATMADLINQVMVGLNTHPEIKTSKRLNIHYARMGEPSWNPDVPRSALHLHRLFNDDYRIHPVVSTMMPRLNKKLAYFLGEWMSVKNFIYDGNAGLQLSINSTDEEERKHMFSNNALTIQEISDIMACLPKPKGRKITLNFAVAGYSIDPEVLLKHFSPEHYIIKLTPMHKTEEATANGIKTEGDYTTFHPYAHYEQALTEAGYDVLVFIASEEEDLGRITCGNAILSGTLPLCKHTIMEAK